MWKLELTDEELKLVNYLMAAEKLAEARAKKRVPILDEQEEQRQLYCAQREYWEATR